MLYEEDYLHPNNQQYIEDVCGDDNQEEMDMYNEQYNMDDISVCSTLNSKKRFSRSWDDTKKIDKGFHRIVRNINYKKQEIEVYSTSTNIGMMIRDAITGSRYNQYKVGSLSEHLFFKVRWSTGELSSNTTVSLFFDSPEQFERHMKTTVSQSVKDKWLKRNAEVRNIEYNHYVESEKPEYIVIK